MRPAASSSRSSRSPNPRTEVDPEGVVLALEPAAAQAEDRPAIRELVEGRRELRGQAGLPERVGADEQAQARRVRQDGERRRASSSPRAWRPRVALVGEQVIVEPEESQPAALDRQAGVAEGRPVRPLIQNAAPNRTGVQSRGVVEASGRRASPACVAIGDHVGERRRQPTSASGQVAPEDDVLVAEQLGHRMVLRAARRDPLELARG